MLTTLGVLADMVAPSPASAEALTIAVSKNPAPTYGTEHLPSPSAFSARVWSTATYGNTTYVGGEFTSLAPTTALAGAIDGQSGAPQPGFPKVDSGQVNVAASDGKGGWFVGGSFPTLSNVQVNGLAHILADGTLDQNFQPAIVGPQNQPSKSFTVNALAVNGPWLYVGGEFTKFGARGTSKAQPRNHIARVSSSSGTIDPDWNPDTGNNNAANPVRSIAVSPDGTTAYFSGDFSTVAGQPRPGIAAFVSDAGGNRLSPWAPQVGPVQALGVAPDGRIYLGTKGGVSALDGNGGVLWSTQSGGGSGVKQLAVSRDGSAIWVGGDFNTIGGQPRAKLAAVHSDGSVDPTFNPAPANGSVISALTLSEDNSRVYFGGTFDHVRDQLRNNLAAVDAHSGELTPWDPNATGAVSSLTASGGLVYAGGNFTNLGATPRTYLGALDVTPGPSFGSALPFAPKIENLGQGAKAGEPPVVQSIVLTADGSRMYIGGNFDHVNGVVRKNLAALSLPGGEVDPNFDPGEPQGTVRVVHLDPVLNVLYAGGDFDSIQIPGSQRLRRPDNDAGCGTPQHKDSVLTPQNRCVWKRSKIAAYDARTGTVDPNFQPPTSTGPGLIGNGGKACSGSGASACGTGAVLSLQLSPDRRQLFASGSFSEMDNNGHKNTIMAIYADGPSRGKLTPWQPQAPNGIPIFDCKVDPNTGMLFGAGGGAGGRAIRWDPQIGSGGLTYHDPAWVHLFDGDSTTVDLSDSVGYWGGHFDFVDGGAWKRKHGAAFDLNGNIAQNWDPEFDTSEGVFSVEVVPQRMVIYGGNFSR
ncbi:MAG: delta-60 repeat domain-containing protein, partial [Actinobacteria bacterium]|nr:delta-60 repeat domain-containing protein [Actinomycetota bacterium]